MLSVVSVVLCLNSAEYLLMSPFFFFGCSAQLVRSSFPDQGSNLGPWQSKYQVLTTEQPGKLLFHSF